MSTPPLPDMSDMPPPPPHQPYQPPPSFQPPPPGGVGGAAQRVQGPAVGLLVTGALGILTALVSLLMNIAGMGMSGLAGDQSAMAANVLSGGVGILFALVGLCSASFILWASLQMRKLEKRQLAFIASIVAMIPCISPCCIIGLPIGIWSLIVLNEPAVQQAFRS